jgi:SH3-like domain-containing protein
MKHLIALLIVIILETFAFSSEKVSVVSSLPIPRFVMLKSKDVNMRSGPGINYQLKMNYKCYHLPFKVLSEFETWRLVKDSNGNEGWIHEAMLDKNKSVEIVFASKQQSKIAILRLPDPKAKAVVLVERGTVANLIKCQGDWCNISLNKTYKGWIHKQNLWGVDN